MLREFYTPGRSNEVELVTGEEQDEKWSAIPFLTVSYFRALVLIMYVSPAERVETIGITLSVGGGVG
jgi:hypothetical protein